MALAVCRMSAPQKVRAKERTRRSAAEQARDRLQLLGVTTAPAYDFTHQRRFPGGLRRHGQAEIKRGPAVQFALHPHRSAMAQYDVFHDGESQAGAAALR